MICRHGTTQEKHLLNTSLEESRTDFFIESRSLPHGSEVKPNSFKNDIIPLCQSREILPIYVDFWMNKDNPEEVFIKSVLEACERKDSILKEITKKLVPSKFSYSAAKQSVEMGFEQKDSERNVSLFETFTMLNNLDVSI